MRKHIVRWSWKYIPKNVRVWVSRQGYALLWVARCGHVYAGRCGCFTAPEAAAQKAQVMESIWRGPMKRKDVQAMVGARVHAAPGRLVETHPNLAEFMTSACFGENGSVEAREAPTITVWCAGGQWRASVKDRAEGLVLFVAAESWVELWQMVELFVMEESAPWRHDEGSLPRVKRK